MSSKKLGDSQKTLFNKTVAKDPILSMKLHNVTQSPDSTSIQAVSHLQMTIQGNETTTDRLQAQFITTEQTAQGQNSLLQTIK